VNTSPATKPGSGWDEGRDVVSATFVIPYPPGFPILVPGQIVSRDILEFMRALDTREIHGYLTGLGYRVFTEEALAEARKHAVMSSPR
jgi:arginine decarboxylase